VEENRKILETEIRRVSSFNKISETPLARSKKWGSLFYSDNR
jgi:hypothetical protein